jgi:polysaccharide export outer membrane protein
MRRMTRILAGLLACAAIAAAQEAIQPPAQTQEAKDLFVRAYRIGPGDLLEIKVFEVDELSQTVRVSEDGTITLPLLGRVPVQGLTQEGVVQKLTELLQAKYVKNPQVTIFIREYKNQQVAVIGAVEKAGSYELVGRKNLLQIVSMAGGFSDKAGNQVFVLRESPDGKTQTIPIDLEALLVGGNQDYNIPIMPNDVINVPVDREIKVFVMGRVNKPGAVTAKFSTGITISQAVADAGGFAEGAKQSSVTVIRKGKGGREQKFKVNLKDILKGKKKDFPLQEGDVVHVPGGFW